MKIKEIDQNEQLYRDALSLRYQLFFKEHGLPNEILNDQLESKSTHVAISIKETLIAYGRLTEVAPQAFQISQIAVSTTFQKKGYGSQLLGHLIQLAKQKGAAWITLNARINALALYEKQGFNPVGEEYPSPVTGVYHIKMEYHVSLK